MSCWIGPHPPCFTQTHHSAVVGLGHEQHAPHQVCGGDALRALALAVAAGPFHLLVGVLTVHRERDVICGTEAR